MFVVACAGVGICTPLANVTIDAYIARTVDQAMLAGTYATQRFGVVAAGAAGLPAAALLISHIGAAAALAVAGGFITCAAAAALWLQARRTAGQDDVQVRRDASRPASCGPT